MSLPQFITVNTTLADMKVKNMIRIDRIHCISEVTSEGSKSVVIHYPTPNGDLESIIVDETMQEISRMLFHTTTGILDIGCGVPDSLPISKDFFEKLTPRYSTEPRHGVMRTTGTEESPKFTTTVYTNTPPIISGV